jgi:hypothetical protein
VQRSEGVWRTAWRRFKGDRVGMVSLVIVLAFLLLIVASASGLVASQWQRELAVPNAPPTIAIDFTERLKDKIRSETRLRLVNQTPHVELGGKVVEYRVVPIAPRPGEESVALNRLEMTVSVYYKNSVKEKSGWAAEKRFNHFAEFSSTADLFSIQDELIRQISNQLLDDIFNAAFNDW